MATTEDQPTETPIEEEGGLDDEGGLEDNKDSGDSPDGGTEDEKLKNSTAAITMKAADGATVTTIKACVYLSMTLRNMMLGDLKENTVEAVKIKTKTTLDFVQRYMTKHQEKDERIWIKKPVKTTKIAEVTGGQVENQDPAEQKLCETDVKFVNEVWADTSLNKQENQDKGDCACSVPNCKATSHEALWALIFSANWLQMRRLVQLCCAKAATEIKGKKEEEVIKILGLDPQSEDVKAVLADKKNAEAKAQA